MLTSILCTLTAAVPAPMQEIPQVKPTEHHKLLLRDIGTWQATMTILGGPEPMKLPAREENELMPGGLWVMSRFEAGPFKGLGQFGYDPVKKKYVGTWIDSTSPHLTIMEGDYNKETGELTMINRGTDPQTKKPQLMKSVAKYTNDAQTEKLFTMYSKDPKSDKWIKGFTIEYKKVPKKMERAKGSEEKAFPKK